MKSKVKLRFENLPRDYVGLCRTLLPRPIRDQVDYSNITEIADIMALWQADFYQRSTRLFLDLLCSDCLNNTTLRTSDGQSQNLATYCNTFRQNHHLPQTCLDFLRQPKPRGHDPARRPKPDCSAIFANSLADFQSQPPIVYTVMITGTKESNR